jgi:hypothetical protein
MLEDQPPDRCRWLDGRMAGCTVSSGTVGQPRDNLSLAPPSNVSDPATKFSFSLYFDDRVPVVEDVTEAKQKTQSRE